MATVWIEEYANAGDSLDGKNINVTGDVKANKKVTIGASSTQSGAFTSQTEYLVIHSDAGCYYSVGDNPTATTSTSHLPSGQFRAIECKPSQKIAIIQE